jgi:hypothetical protein
MLCPRQCEIVAPVPAPHARTADISRLASRRRSYACAAVTNHTNCNAVKQRAKTSNATMILNPAMVLPWRQFFSGMKITSDLQSECVLDHKMVECLQAGHQETQAKPRLALIFNPIFRRDRIDQRRFPREPKMIWVTMRTMRLRVFLRHPRQGLLIDVNAGRKLSAGFRTSDEQHAHGLRPLFARPLRSRSASEIAAR